MDQFWRVLRIGCISVFVVIALGVGSCILLVQLDEWPKRKARAALWSRSVEILNQKKSHRSIAKLSDLFGNDIDGVCVVLTGPANEGEMRKLSPGKFGPVIAQIARMRDVRSTFGKPWEGDVEYLFVYAVSGDQVRRKYQLVFRSALEIDLTDGTTERCYESQAPVHLEYYPSGMMITIPPQKAQDRQPL